MKSSYNIENVATNIHREVERLEGQLKLFWDEELKYYMQCGLSDGMSVLDCGSGPGHLILRLSNEFPTSEIYGLEIDPLLFEISKNLLNEYKPSKYRISEGSIMETGFDDNRFDFIISRLVLEHLPDPISAVKEVKRILKPGGVAVFVANDFAYHLRTFPDIPELEDLYRAYCRCRIDEGGNPYIGRDLPAVLNAAGMFDIELKIIGVHSSFVGDVAFLKSEGSGISNQLIKDGYLDKGIFDNLVLKWRNLLNENHSIFRQLFYCSGKKENSQHLPINNKDDKLAERLAHNVIELKSRVNSLNAQSSIDDIETYFYNLVLEVLEIEPKHVELDTSLEAIGLDSLSAATMQAHIEADLGVEISISEFFCEQSVVSISKTLLERFKQELYSGDDKDENMQKTAAKMSIETCQTVEWEEGEI
jgi:ubiquinone/menaquinone biosynthesis C-methylase UbiE/acyl carrier protein